MNGVVLGSKAIVVRLHEPKHFRQEKLAQRFASGGHPRSASGATSPTHSDGGESTFGGWNSPRHASSPLASPHDKPTAGRRASGSYYHAALNGTLNAPLNYDDLSALTPIVRREILTGELSRRVRTLGMVPATDIDAVVEGLVGLSLGEVVRGLHDNARLSEQIVNLQQGGKSDAESADLDGSTLAGTVTAPEHPSTPVSLVPGGTPPRTASPAASLPLQMSERDRMVAAVARLAPGPEESALTDLLMTLPKRERALCLFNNDLLRQKIAEARAVLEADDDEEPAATPAPVVPASTPSVRKPVDTPELSRAPSTTEAPAPVMAEAPAEEGAYTLTTLAKLPAAEIVRIARAGAATGVPLPKEKPDIVAATDAFIDGLIDKPIQQQKQALGDKLCVTLAYSKSSTLMIIPVSKLSRALASKAHPSSRLPCLTPKTSVPSRTS
jgi:polyadenylate-binding protein